MISEAETLAGEFLEALLLVSADLKQADLDARMRKSGVKSIKAAVYLEESSKAIKKPTEATLSALVDQNKLVVDQQTALDTAEVNKEHLERMFLVFKEAHVHFRGISKGKYE
jgi:tRNA(Phe) wybutosine-synthesizing methylase Tyw3